VFIRRYALSVTTSPGSVQHWRISSVENGTNIGFALEKRQFASLSKLVQTYAEGGEALKFPPSGTIFLKGHAAKGKFKEIVLS
jgi:hypothetical protein